MYRSTVPIAKLTRNNIYLIAIMSEYVWKKVKAVIKTSDLSVQFCLLGFRRVKNRLSKEQCYFALFRGVSCYLNIYVASDSILQTLAEMPNGKGTSCFRQAC